VRMVLSLSVKYVGIALLHLLSCKQSMLVLVSFLISALIWRFWVDSLRVAFCRGFVTTSLFAVVVTETLSLGQRLFVEDIFQCWVLYVLSQLLVLAYLKFNKSHPARHEDAAVDKGWLFPSRVLILAMLVPTAVVALSVLPTTADCMAYHFTRVEHWLQSGTLAHFPTSDYQIHYSQPLAEMLYVQLRACHGDDKLACFMSWLASVVVLLSLLGLNEHHRHWGKENLITALWLLSMPTLIMHQTAAKNDIIALSFCMIFWSEGRRLVRRHRESTFADYFILGSAAGLALLTKATVLFFLVPLVSILVFRLFRDVGKLPFGSAAISVLIALLIVAPHSARNITTFGSALGPGKEYSGVEYKNGEFTISGIASNLFKNCLLHLTTPWERSNHILYGISSRYHRVIGEDANNPMLNWDGRMLELYPLRLSEANDGQPLHFLCLLTAVLIALRSKNLSALGAESLLVASVGFVLFCTVLRWQTWHPRLHLQFFLLATPFVVEQLSRLPRFCCLAVLGLVVAAFPWMCWTEGRPLLGADSVLRVPADVRFRRIIDSDGHYTACAEAIIQSKAPRLGVVWLGRALDYPLFCMLRYCSDGQRIPSIQHVFVGPGNLTTGTGSGSTFKHEHVSCPLIAMDSTTVLGDRLPSDVLVRRTEIFGPMQCFWP